MIQNSCKTLNIVIIGGGFSGATVALNLLRRLPPHTASITVIEPRPILGGGVAYSSTDPAHRLNVPASRMLVLAEEPGAFEAWFKTSGALDDDPAALLEDGRIYPRRGIFGRYVNALVRAAAASSATPFDHHQSRAETIAKLADGSFEITTHDATTIAADIVVLAVSHPPPAVPGPFRAVSGEKKFIANPWPDNAITGVGQQDRVLIIGTALSTADVIASLHAQGHQGQTLAVSRRGLVSRLRKMAQTEPFGDFSSNPSRTALELVKQVRKTVAKAEASGSSWGAVMDGIRLQGLTVWSALPAAEKSRFLRHVRPFWDVHRYQVAPQLAAITDAQCEAGALTIRAARIRSASFNDGRFTVKLQYRQAAPVDEAFDAIINCTGPDHTRIIETNPVLAALNKANLIRADEFGLGLQTDLTARTLDATGTAQSNLFVAGPLARASFGELMGLPQVSLHAALVASEVEKAVVFLQRNRLPSKPSAPAPAPG
jgi:uncharacterized NAD(P)/FAD-binding protein YdhS